MQRQANMSTPSATIRGVLMLLVVVCLVECATGSCLSYGHSCWGAHGKRSEKLPASAPDWYITRILRQMAANNEMNRAQQNEDDLFRGDDSPNKYNNEVEEIPLDLGARGEAKPMLDDDMLSKMKIWEIMRAASQEK